MNVQLDQIFHSLADPTRRDILQRLTGGELSVTEIAQSYNMTLAAVSKHLKVLERAQLVTRRRDGKRYLLLADTKPLKDVDSWIDFFRKYWEDRFEQLDDYLTDLKRNEKHE